MNNHNLESNVLHSRRLIPKDTHERYTSNELKTTVTQALNNNGRLQNSPTTFNNGTTSCSDRLKVQEGELHQDFTDQQKQNSLQFVHRSSKCSSEYKQRSQKHAAARKAFDTKPFYNEVKPHVTAQKRVRYPHLKEEFALEKRRLPKENLHGPKIYESREGGQRKHTGKNEKVPISLNTILR